MSTSILPLRLGTALLGQYVEPGAEAPKRITVHGECWELVTDPLLDIALVTEDGDAAAQEAFAARLANILHLNVGNLFVTEGAVVNELVAQRIAVAVARVIELDADRITSGIIDTSHLNAGAIAAAVATVIELNASRITSGTISTARLNTREIAAAVANVIELNADRITSGIISTARLDASAIASAVATIIELNADRITSGTLDADRIAAHSITAAKILVDEELAAELVSAMTVATKRLIVTEDAILNRATIINGLAADVVSAATIYASQLVVTALDEHGDIVPGAVDTVQIADGAVRAAQIHAEEVAGVVARFLTIEVGQLVAGAADIDTLVAQKIAGATADFQEAFIQNLRSNGAVIDEAVIGELAANIISSGLFRTAAAGQRLEIDSSGLVMYGLDPDGVEFELVRIGPDGENLITAGDTTISPAGVAAPQGDFDTLSVGGDELTTIIDRIPRGVISFMWVAGASAWHGVNENIKRIEAEATLEPGRRYRISLDSHNVQLRSASPMQYVTLLRAEMPRGSGMTNIATARYHLTGTTENQPIGQLVGWVDTIDRTTPIDAIFDYVVRGSAGRDHRISNTDSKLRLTVEDVGPALVSTGTSYMDEGTPQEGSSQAPPKEDPVRRYTNVQWNAGGYGGDTSAGDVVQGYYSGVGMRSGGWVFPSAMRTALAGATIEKLEVYLYASHWYWGSGGTASIRPNNGSYQGWVGSAFTSPNWPRNHGRWVKVPSSWHSAIAAGTYRGVGVQTSSTNSLYYGRFTGSATKFRATYRK